MEEKTLYSCPEPVYASQGHPMRTEREILSKSWRLIKKWYLAGVADSTWDELTEDLHASLRRPYLDSDRPVRALALGMERAVCEYLEARAFDDCVPSRREIMMKRNAEIAKMLGEAMFGAGKDD